MNTMYLTIEETAKLLSIPEPYLVTLIAQKQIRAIHDGERYLINKEQFNTHMEQMQKYKRLVEEALNEPIPEDLNVKDED
jgi:excisionase family DNA binding protein